MSRLFYPVLFSVTASLATTLWMRHGLPTQWLTALGAAVAQAQTPPSVGNGAPPPWKGTANKSRRGGPQRLPPTDQPNSASEQVASDSLSRARQAPYTQLQIETPGGPKMMEVTRPVPVVSAKVVGQFGDEIILAADVLPIVNEKFEAAKLHYPEEKHEQLYQALMFQCVNQAVRAKIIVANMKESVPKDKFPEMEKEILKHFQDTQLGELKKHWKVQTEAELDAKLKEHGSSLKKQRKAFVDMILISEWQKKEIKIDEHVSHRDLLKYYDEHLPEYQFPAKVRFEEIRINYGRKRNKRAAYELIHKLGSQIYAGARMADLAKAHSEGLKAENGGLHDWTNQGSVKCDELDAKLFSLPIGVLSDVIDEGRAFLIVRVVERTEAGTTSFADAQAGIKEKIKAQRKQDATNKRVAEFFEKELPRAWTIYDDYPQTANKPGDKKMR